MIVRLCGEVAGPSLRDIPNGVPLPPVAGAGGGDARVGGRLGGPPGGRYQNLFRERNWTRWSPGMETSSLITLSHLLITFTCFYHLFRLSKVYQGPGVLSR